DTPVAPPTDTPVPPTPTPEPSPVVQVAVETLNVRQGPGTSYARIGQVREGDRLQVIARSPAGEWYLVCCVGGDQGWVAAKYVRLVEGATAAIPVTTAIPPTPRPQPTNTPAPPPTATTVPATPTPTYPFVAREVIGYAYDKPYLTIKGKIWDAKAQKALPGYYLKVFRNGADAGLSEVSRPGFSDATCPDCGDNRKVNVKYEYNPAGDVEWEVYVVDANGNRVSESLRFTTSSASPQWFYVDFALR
ncbi:MAG: SH3 domain-containing protein, partial [Anaerolineae bacterium]|nr:SH3 domain-containing protein [Anaerolineae bacterium]